MTLADSHEIDRALIALLRADALLTGYAPDGVWFESAGQNAQHFVLVSITESLDTQQFGRRAWDDILFSVDAVMLIKADGSNDADEAAARINELLDGQPLTVNGFAYMTMHRVSRIAEDEHDDQTPSIVFYHRGGRYRVQMTPL